MSSDSAPATWRERLRLPELLLPLLSYKVALLAVVLLSFQLLPAMFSERHYRANFHWPEDASPTLATAFSTWDGQHYIYLSEEGYSPGESSAFFPLWPFVIWVFSHLFFGNHLIAGLVLSNLASLLALLLFYSLALKRYSREVADSSLLLYLSYPGSLFLLFPYSESLFLFLSLLFFSLLHERRYAWASVPALLLPLTRAVGIFIVFPLLYEVYRERRERGSINPHLISCILAPLVGLCLYFLVMSTFTGDPWTGIETQRSFIGHRAMSQVFDIPGFFSNLLNVTSVHDYLGSALDRVFFLILLGLLVRIWKLDVRYFIFALVMGVVPPLTGTFWCYTRYLVVVFPLFLAMGKLLSGERGRAYLWVLLSVLFSLQILLLIRHVNNYWAG